MTLRGRIPNATKDMMITCPEIPREKFICTAHNKYYTRFASSWLIDGKAFCDLCADQEDEEKLR